MFSFLTVFDSPILDACQSKKLLCACHLPTSVFIEEQIILISLGGNTTICIDVTDQRVVSFSITYCHDLHVIIDTNTL